MVKDVKINKKKHKAMLQESMQNSGSSGHHASSTNISCLGSDHMHKVVSEGKKLRQTGKGILPGDAFGNMFRVGSDI